MKRRNAFTMFEIILSLFVLSSSVYVLTSLQMRALFRVLKDRDEVEKVFLMKRRLYEVFYKPIEEIKSSKEKLEDAEVVLNRNFIEISPKSELRDYKKILQLVYVQAEWQRDAIKRDERMVAIIGKPTQQEKE